MAVRTWVGHVTPPPGVLSVMNVGLSINPVVEGTPKEDEGTGMIYYHEVLGAYLTEGAPGPEGAFTMTFDDNNIPEDAAEFNGEPLLMLVVIWSDDTDLVGRQIFGPYDRDGNPLTWDGEPLE